jgi:hypothetical protein
MALLPDSIDRAFALRLHVRRPFLFSELIAASDAQRCEDRMPNGVVG